MLNSVTNAWQSSYDPLYFRMRRFRASVIGKRSWTLSEVLSFAAWRGCSLRRPCFRIASRDDHHRLALVTAVLVESATGKVIFYNRSAIQTSDAYTLDPSKFSGLKFQIIMTSDNVDMRRSWASLAVLCSMFMDISRIADYKGCHLVNSCVRRLEWGLKVCKDQLDNSLATRSTTWIPSRDDGFKLIHTRNDESGSVAALRWRMPSSRISNHAPIQTSHCPPDWDQAVFGF